MDKLQAPNSTNYTTDATQPRETTYLMLLTERELFISDYFLSWGEAWLTVTPINKTLLSDFQNKKHKHIHTVQLPWVGLPNSSMEPFLLMW